jgi:hypothetical protein
MIAYVLEVSTSEAVLDNVRDIPCDPLNYEDRRRCELRCVLEGFRAGFCVRFDGETFCKCVN